MDSPIRIGNSCRALPSGHAGEMSFWKYRLQCFVKIFSINRTQQKSLRHIETLSLGAKRNLHLVECEGQRFIVSDGLSAPVPLTQQFAAEERR